MDVILDDLFRYIKGYCVIFQLSTFFDTSEEASKPATSRSAAVNFLRRNPPEEDALDNYVGIIDNFIPTKNFKDFLQWKFWRFNFVFIKILNEDAMQSLYNDFDVFIKIATKQGIFCFLSALLLIRILN